MKKSLYLLIVFAVMCDPLLARAENANEEGQPVRKVVRTCYPIDINDASRLFVLYPYKDVAKGGYEFTFDTPGQTHAVYYHEPGAEFSDPRLHATEPYVIKERGDRSAELVQYDDGTFEMSFKQSCSMISEWSGKWTMNKGKLRLVLLYTSYSSSYNRMDQHYYTDTGDDQIFEFRCVPDGSNGFTLFPQKRKSKKDKQTIRVLTPGELQLRSYIPHLLAPYGYQFFGKEGVEFAYSTPVPAGRVKEMEDEIPHRFTGGYYERLTQYDDGTFEAVNGSSRLAPNDAPISSSNTWSGKWSIYENILRLEITGIVSKSSNGGIHTLNMSADKLYFGVEGAGHDSNIFEFRYVSDQDKLTLFPLERPLTKNRLKEFWHSYETDSEDDAGITTLIQFHSDGTYDTEKTDSRNSVSTKEDGFYYYQPETGEIFVAERYPHSEGIQYYKITERTEDYITVLHIVGESGTFPWEVTDGKLRLADSDSYVRKEIKFKVSKP